MTMPTPQKAEVSTPNGLHCNINNEFLGTYNPREHGVLI